MKIKKILIYTLLATFMSVGIVHAQEVDLENMGNQVKEALKKNPFRLTGGVSANGVFYNSNTENSRAPFTYFLNGNLNLGFYQWSLPISYSLTNQGASLGYQLPFNFNRISLHPKYKWIRGHIGDVSMTLSPYTFNGLLFRGAGIELSPDIPLKIAAFGGQLNKAIEDDGNPNTIPAFRRFGYGLHLKWEKSRYKVGIIGFYAKDNLSSLDSVPQAKGILPQENIALSFNAKVFVLDNLEAFGEFARSGITNDLRVPSLQRSKDPIALFLSENSSTEYLNAYNAGINWSLSEVVLGVRYERIDPDYRTLGAYYFNNDMENITINANFNLFQGALTLGTNIGRQKDNLSLQKQKQTSRWIGAINANWKLSDRLIITGSYSNFTMFTNSQLNQFTNINRNPLLLQQPKDSIDYKQIAQNANVNINYVISANEDLTQNLHAGYSLNDMVNRENNVVRKGSISRFHNANLNYVLGFPRIKMNIATSLNYTNTYAASQTMHIFGPSLTVGKTFLEDKLQLSLSTSYNRSDSPLMKVNVANLQLGASYSPWQRHNFTASIIQMFRSSTQVNQSSLSELTATVGYAFSF